MQAAVEVMLAPPAVANEVVDDLERSEIDRHGVPKALLFDALESGSGSGGGGMGLGAVKVWRRGGMGGGELQGLRGCPGDACREAGAERGGEGCGGCGELRPCMAGTGCPDQVLWKKAFMLLLVGGWESDSLSVCISLGVPRSLLHGMHGLSSTLCCPGHVHVVAARLS